MNYLIIENNIISNIIVCDELFASQVGALPYYEGANIGDTYNPNSNLTPSELREQAYNTEKLVDFNSQSLTVTEASQLWQYYAAEGSDKANELQVLISNAKTSIREKYPD